MHIFFTLLPGQIPGVQEKIFTPAAVPLEHGLDLAAQKLDPLAAVGVGGEDVSLAAVKVG
jgi:hypothetical protein